MRLIRVFRRLRSYGLPLSLMAAVVGGPALVIAADKSPGLSGAMIAKAKRLIAAYPDHLERLDGRQLVWRDGTRMPFDDGRRSKTFNQLLNTADIEDQFHYSYPAGRAATQPPLNSDPGRIRNDRFFTKMYGDCRRGRVRPKLVPVKWLPERGGGIVNVTRVNGVDKKLAAVSRELGRLPAAMTRFLVPASGVYNCRTISGTNRRSVHAYGAAIDINIKAAHYWRWSKPAKSGRYTYQNSIPLEIVRIFEKHGFIWGGRWYHYDTMHFEYRPELLP